MRSAPHIHYPRGRPRGRGLVLLLAWFAAACSLNAQEVIPAATHLGGLDKLRGNHPRLFVNADELERIQGELDAGLAPEWTALRAAADEIVSLGKPHYQEARDAQTWGREDGNRLSTLAFAWLVSRDRAYLDAASIWARAISSRPVWGLDAKTGQPADHGLVFGHLLTGLAMFYDYARDDMDAETRDLVRRSLREHAAVSAARLKAGTWDTEGHALQSNHTWVYSAGVMAAGLALLDEEPDAPAWIGLPLAILRASDAMLSTDGASQEGYGYYQYGTEYLLKLITMAESLGFSEAKSPWWDHTVDYNFWMLTPRNTWTKDMVQVDFSDADRHPWYGPDHLLRWLARRNQDGRAQWLADTLDGAGVVEPTAPWLALVWKDAAVKAVPPTDYPTLHHFANMGIVAARSDWSGDEALLIFKSGNPIGDHAYRNHRERVHHGEYYHIHRDSNHFCLFGAGQWLIRNPGYARWDTRFHNTLLVDGRGQKGDRDPAVPDEWPLTDASRFPRIVSATTTPQVDRIVGDATAAYPADSGLQSFVRELIFIKPDVLVVIDRVTADSERHLELRFLPESLPVLQPDGSFLCQGDRANLRVEFLHREHAAVKTATLPVKSRNTRPASPLHMVTLENKAATWTNITALSWASKGTAPRQVTLIHADGKALLRVGDFDVPIEMIGPPVTLSQETNQPN